VGVFTGKRDWDDLNLVPHAVCLSGSSSTLAGANATVKAPLIRINARSLSQNE
jgi:hypothetical protein